VGGAGRLRGSPGRILYALALAGLLATTGWAHARVSEQVGGEEAQGFVPRPEFVRIASFGFTSLAADYYWLLAVQLVGGAVVDSTTHAPRIGKLLDVVTGLDPWVDHPYRFGAVWMIDSEDSVRHANELLRRGISYHPGEWRDRFYLGFNQFYYLDDNKAAAETLEAAAQLSAAPPYLGRLVARLRSESDGLDAAAMFLEELVRHASNDYERGEYEKALAEIETERRARFLDAARAEYKRRNGKDILDVTDLLAEPSPVLRQLPAEPNGSGWKLDDSGQIVSTHSNSRYVVHRDAVGQALQARWHGKSKEGGALQ